MSDDRQPLTQIVGRLGKDPEKKSTPKGDVVEFSVAQSDGFGDDAKTNWYRASTWNEGLQDSILSPQSGLRKGSLAFVNGVVVDRGQYGFDIKAVQVGVVELFDRSKSNQQQTAAPAESSADDF